MACQGSHEGGRQRRVLAYGKGPFRLERQEQLSLSVAKAPKHSLMGVLDSGRPQGAKAETEQARPAR